MNLSDEGMNRLICALSIHGQPSLSNWAAEDHFSALFDDQYPVRE